MFHTLLLSGPPPFDYPNNRANCKKREISWLLNILQPCETNVHNLIQHGAKLKTDACKLDRRFLFIHFRQSLQFSNAALYLLMFWPLVICCWGHLLPGGPVLQRAIMVLKISFVPLPVSGEQNMIHYMLYKWLWLRANYKCLTNRKQVCLECYKKRHDEA